MASLQALGGAPASYVDSNGIQYVIPLSLITFPSATGAANASGWLSGFSTNQQAALSGPVGAWLQSLTGQGLLSASAVPAAPPAFTIAARDAGSAGNDITVTFANVVPNGANPGQTIADVTVSTKQVYQNLTLQSIVTLLGTAQAGTIPGGGTQPGLAYVSGVGAALPAVMASPVSFPSAAPVQVAVPATASGTAFTLVANHPDEPDAHNLTAQITAGSSATTFTLTLAWTKSATKLPLALLQTTFGYLVTFTTPPGGFAYPPAAGTITLLGGNDAAASPAVAAQAVVVAG